MLSFQEGPDSSHSSYSGNQGGSFYPGGSYGQGGSSAYDSSSESYGQGGSSVYGGAGSYGQVNTICPIYQKLTLLYWLSALGSIFQIHLSGEP
ncbi:loricrin-like [Dryobates pubescens]|uniref:loricrin-like n=1 Tax=Dryobates pubescens TaxID=118200 RepID=UPI0023B9CDA7|nr:loricrin-like [Dryobates pubescens]